MKLYVLRQKKIIYLTIFFLFSCLVQAQEYALLNDLSFIKVSGTSTLHDWHVDGEEQSGVLKLSGEESPSIKELLFKVKAESLKSGKSSMDKNTYKALKTDKYKDIIFEYKKTNTSVKKDLNTYTISVNGTLTVTGVSKNVDLNLEVIIEGDLIKINGKKDILMTDFEIDPPKALLGTIKTGNEITITYKSVFQTN
ncbi:MAG: YceI family protein [Winogradskyella sp.]|nr:YceI family protein [Winogradskyella sp.]